MKKRKTIPKINSVHFGLQWISISILVGVIVPCLGSLIFHKFWWPLCIIGIVILLAFVIVFTIEMHQDFGKVPYYKQRLKEDIPFDKENQSAVIKCSICTGEQVAGFKNKDDGHFTEVMIIRTDEDLEYFKKIYDIDTIRKEY